MNDGSPFGLGYDFGSFNVVGQGSGPVQFGSGSSGDAGPSMIQESAYIVEIPASAQPSPGSTSEQTDGTQDQSASPESASAPAESSKRTWGKRNSTSPVKVLKRYRAGGEEVTDDDEEDSDEGGAGSGTGSHV